jgi:vancomycin resistance protein VanW
VRTSLPLAKAAPTRALPEAASSRRAALVYAAKVRVLQARRLALWTLRPREFSAPQVRDSAAWPVLLAGRSVAISRDDGHQDARLEEGKRINLELAARAFDGLLLEPGVPISFWRVLGRLTEARGYRLGLEVSAGCLIPAIGGGICLLANALFEAAVRAGMQIVERHGHTLEAVPPREGELWGLDATVFWPYVDLRWAAVGAAARLGVEIAGERLVVSFTARAASARTIELSSTNERFEVSPDGPLRINQVRRRILAQGGAVTEERVIAENRRRVLGPEELSRTCYSCGEDRCHRRQGPGPHAPKDPT